METVSSHTIPSFTRETGDVDAGYFPLWKFLRLSLKICRKDFFKNLKDSNSTVSLLFSLAWLASCSCATRAWSVPQWGNVASSEFPYGDMHNWKKAFVELPFVALHFPQQQNCFLPAISYTVFQKTAFVLEKYHFVPKRLLHCSKLS